MQGIVPQPHDRTLAELLFYLRQRVLKRLAPFVIILGHIVSFSIESNIVGQL
jgi:hypothetical protein